MTQAESTANWPTGYWEPAYIPGRGNSVAEIEDRCIKPFAKETTVLEIGPGAGFWTNRLSCLAAQVIAVDVIACPARFTALCPGNNVRYVTIADTGILNCVPSKTIGFVWSYDVFCHLSHTVAQTYLNEMTRVLAPNGNAVLMFPHWQRHPDLKTTPPLPRNVRNAATWYYYDDDIILELCRQAGLIVIEIDMLPANRDRLVRLARSNNPNHYAGWPCAQGHPVKCDMNCNKWIFGCAFTRPVL